MLKKILFFIAVCGVGYWAWNHHFGVHRVTQGLNDGSITAEILAKIAKEDPLALLSIKVSTTQGIATLGGQVRSASQKEKILSLARQTEGVREVQDRLSLDHRLRTPEEMKKDLALYSLIKKSLLQEEGLRGIDIHVAVDQGQVVLSGKIPNSEQANLAVKLARAVPGVKKVQNQIQVSSP